MQEIAETRERGEIGCDDCFEALDRFITIQLAGLDTAEAMTLVHEHLHMCRRVPRRVRSAPHSPERHGRSLRQVLI
jgi:hypothetical protein